VARNKLIYGVFYIEKEKNGSRFKPASGYEDHPVVDIYLHGANEYAKWVGGRLPTEAEWEKAARGGLVGRRYPNGDSISKDDANYDSEGTMPVKSFAPNGYGLYDMAGNVWEWCSDCYGIDYYSKSPRDNPTGTLSDSCLNHVIRGGGYYNDSNFVRCSLRASPSYDGHLNYAYQLSGVGFRVVFASGGW